MRVLFIEEYLPQEMLGLMWVSRAVKDAGHESKALFLPDTKWVEKLREYAPDVVCYSTTTGMHLYYADINRKVKEVLPNVLSIVGGPHPTFVPEYVETPGIDAICRGEGEAALVDLLNRMRDGKDYNDCENFWIKDRKTGEIHKNPQRPLVQDLDSLGFPDRDVVYEAGEIYRNTHRKVFVSQRGCPMPCSFCFHHAWKKKVYNVRNSEYVRKRSVTHLLEEIKAVRAKYPLKFVHFVDDIFNLRNDWLDEFCERYPKEIGLPFDVILMANMTTEDHIKKLRAAGCVYARIAFEAANDYIRNAVFKKHTTRQQLLDAAGWIKKYGIRLGSLNMLGGPGSTLEDEFDSVKLNIEASVDHPLVSIMQPYPMFDINDITKQMGFAVAAYDDFPEKFNRTSSILFDNRREIENLHKLFPLIVRFPSLMRFAPRLIRVHWMAKAYLILYMLYSEWMVAEQAQIYSKAQGLKGPRYWATVDFAYRLSTKGVLRVYQVVFSKVFERFMAPKTHQMTMALQMGDERVVSHMD
ncbi:MAG: B12-binding domain-containing radical SAM protein [Planctomycetes bacterium]|nr:B12-binding domain-containing radical SAM protein [Planctomycetota bacterium]